MDISNPDPAPLPSSNAFMTATEVALVFVFSILCASFQIGHHSTIVPAIKLAEVGEKLWQTVQGPLKSVNQ